MCGRFALAIEWAKILKHYNIRNFITNYEYLYNIAPSINIYTIKNENDNVFELSKMKWGFVPFFSRNYKNFTPIVNARYETISEKISFKNAFKKRRCLIPATGYYEWKNTSKGKNPFYIYSTKSEIISFAGIYERFESEENSYLGCTIITVSSNSAISEIHHRMPAIIQPEDYNAWLAGNNVDIDYENYKNCSELKFHPVSKLVNNPRNNFPKCIEQINC